MNSWRQRGQFSVRQLSDSCENSLFPPSSRSNRPFQNENRKRAVQVRNGECGVRNGESADYADCTDFFFLICVIREICGKLPGCVLSACIRFPSSPSLVRRATRPVAPAAFGMRFWNARTRPRFEPQMNLSSGANGVTLCITAFPTNTYRLQTSTNLSSWTDWMTNGPFATLTNINQTINGQAPPLQFFRLLVQ